MFRDNVEISPGLEFRNEPKEMAVHRETGIKLIVDPGCKVGEHHEYWMLEGGPGLYVDLSTGQVRPLINRITMVAGLDGVGISNGRPDAVERQSRLQARSLLPVHPVIGHRPTDPAKELEWEQSLLEPENLAKFERHYANRGVKINLDAWRPHVMLAGLLTRISDEERTNSHTEAARLKTIYKQASERLEALIKSIEQHRRGVPMKAPRATHGG